MTVSKASLSKVQYTTPIPDVPDPATIDSVANVGTSRGYNDGAATVSYTAVATGGTPVTFTATSNPGSYSASGSSPITVTGLQSDTSYTFTMSGTNATGTGSSGTASSSITATTVPNAPTVGTATRTSDTVVSLAFTAPANGGSAITGYTITSSPSVAITTQAGTSSPLTATATYVAGTEYTFTITATNANGTSSASSASNGVTPKAIVSFTTNYLVVAGGGGAVGASESNQSKGTGGAGGYRTSYSTSGKNSSPESALTLVTGTTYPVTVGAGGAGTRGNKNPGGHGDFHQTAAAQNGASSIFSTITSLGGGATSATGGSGGGNSGKGTANQGHDGGGNQGGGGGAGGAGGAGDYNVHHAQFSPGSGGVGLSSPISSSAVTRAAGGQGANHTAGTGGGSAPGNANGAANTGGGAGNPSQPYGGVGAHGAPDGGSGVVILRYPATRTITVGAGLTGSTSTSGDDKITTITAGTGNVIWE
jgi:hypothetical protein